MRPLEKKDNHTYSSVFRRGRYAWICALVLMLIFLVFFSIGNFLAPQAAAVKSPRIIYPPHVAVVKSPRIIYYYQTLTDLSPLIKSLNPATKKPYPTDIFLASFHLGQQSDGTKIHLNDYPPTNAAFHTPWQQLGELQGMGVKLHMMLGGAACCSYQELFSHWNTLYPVLKQTLQTYHFNGIDLDIEQSVALSDVQRLIDQLYADFGSGFQITLAPVASDLTQGVGLSGFSYKSLYQSPEGSKIAWFNTQFYSGFGSLSSPSDYESAINNGFPADKVVAGMLGNPHDGSGYVDVKQVALTVTQLIKKYPTFGGVFSWEYFDTLPGGTTHPEQWSHLMDQSMKK